MLIFEGPDLALRAALFQKFKARYNAAFTFHQNGDGIRCDLNYLLKVVHADHRLQVRDGWPGTGDPVEDAMLGLALQASGSMVAWCGPNEDASHVPHVPIGHCPSGYDLEELVYLAGDWWQNYRRSFEMTYEYGHTGRCYGRPVMLVGDRYNPFVPLEDARRLAFTGKTGSCRFLHQAILLAPPQHYYVTNATKYDKPKRDVAALAREIDLVQPAKIVALGTEAATMLVRTHNSFHLTCHPQFWHRFRQGREAELAADISLTKTKVSS
jgi:hypothetical protein